jgi:hypothetical protein
MNGLEPIGIYRFLWRTSGQNRWYKKDVKAESLAWACAGLLNDFTKQCRSVEALEIDHLVAEFRKPMDGSGVAQQVGLHSLVHSKNHFPLYFKNKAWPVAHFPVAP